jgi:hypothetical protein
MTTHDQNKKAIREGQQGGPAQKNQNTQLGLSGEQALKKPGGVQRDEQNSMTPNPGQTGTPGGKGKQDATQNQKR